MNLFVGVVADTFTEIRDKQKYRGFFIDESQKQWLQLLELFERASGDQSGNTIPPPSKAYSFRKNIHTFISYQWFDLFIMGCICVNILVMSTWFYNHSYEYGIYLEVLNIFFAFIFLIEAILKLIGLGIKQYFSSSWNVFDFCIVIGSLVGFILSLTIGGGLLKTSDSSFDPTILRVFRMLRIVRLIKTAKSLKKQIRTLVKSSKAIANVGTLLLLLFFVYSVMGMSLFGNIPESEFISAHNNFNTFGNSMLLLYRCSTGESWNGVMHDCMPRYNCDGDSCGSYFAIPFFVSFIVLGVFIMLNLFVAIILQYFAEEDGVSIGKIGLDDLNLFNEKWLRNCPTVPWWKFWVEKTSPLGFSIVCRIIENLPQPLGLVGFDMNDAQKIKFFAALDIPVEKAEDGGYYITYASAIIGVSQACNNDVIMNCLSPPSQLPTRQSITSNFNDVARALSSTKVSRNPSMSKFLHSRYSARGISDDGFIFAKSAPHIVDLGVLYATIKLQALARGKLQRLRIVKAVKSGVPLSQALEASRVLPTILEENVREIEEKNAEVNVMESKSTTIENFESKNII